MFIIGAFDIPAEIDPASAYDGVVLMTEVLGGGGALLSTGRHVVTAAHVVSATGDDVYFEMDPDLYTPVQVLDRFRAPGSSPFSATAGNDIGLVQLAWVAPYGAQRYDIYRDDDELFQSPRLVGVGPTGLGDYSEVTVDGDTGLRVGGNDKRSGLNRWEADGSLLSNEVIRVMTEGSPTGGTFRLKLGDVQTPAIPYNATASQLYAALDTIDGIGIDRAVGGPLPTPIFVTFQGQVSEDDTNEWTTQSGGLTGGDDPRTRLSILTRGDVFHLPSGTAFLADFDNGDSTYDTLGTVYGINGLGQGANEVSSNPGDSGSPYFLDGKVAGVVSGGTSFNVSPPDFDTEHGLGSFGDINVITRVSAYESWIDSVLDDNYDLWLHMGVQPDSRDATDDTIVARVNSSNEIELVVNGTVYHRDSLSRIDSLKITGGLDRETYILDPSLLAVADFPITISGQSGETVIADRSDVTTNLHVSIGETSIGSGSLDNFLRAGASITLGNFMRMEVRTGSGNDEIDARASANVLTLKGGGGNDTIHDGPLNSNLYGGPGNDTYKLYDWGSLASKQFFEAADEGTDTIDASAVTAGPVVTRFNGSIRYQGITGTLDQPENIELSKNIVPYLSEITGPTFGVTQQQLNYSATFISTGTQMTHSAKIDWQDPPPATQPGIVGQSNHLGDVNGSYVYTTQGIRTITFTLTNSDGMSTTRDTTVVIDNVGVGPDPERPGQTALFVGGTGAANVIQLTSSTPGPITTTIDGVNEGTFSPTGGIYIYAGPGSDVVQLVPPVNQPTRVEAGTGDDVVYGGGGNDILLGQDGADALFGMGGNDTIDGGDGLDRLYGLEGDDALVGGLGNDFLYGGNGDDQFYAGDGHDYLYGEAGNDLLLGGAGNDWLDAGSGNDIAIGGLGKDTLNGVDGEDLLIGGSTASDNNSIQLHNLWVAWRASASFDARVASMAGLINSSTVTDTEAGETVLGSIGRDWLIDYALLDYTDYSIYLGDRRN